MHTLADCAEVWGPQQEAFLARELTKLHEQTIRGPLHLLKAEVEVGGLVLLLDSATLKTSFPVSPCE